MSHVPFPSSEPRSFQCIIFIISVRKRLSGVKDHPLRKQSCGSNGAQPRILLALLSLRVCPSASPWASSACAAFPFHSSLLNSCELTVLSKGPGCFSRKGLLPFSHPGLRGGQPCHGSCSSGLSSPRDGNRSTKLEDPATESR